MPETFGFRLKRFALAVDIVDDEIFDAMWTLIRDYVSKHLALDYWALLIEGDVIAGEADRRPGLHAIHNSLGQPLAFPLERSDGSHTSYTGLAAYAFKECKALWVVDPKEKVLSPATTLSDAWSGITKLPNFDRPENDGIRTVILVPIRQEGRRPIGLLDLQSRDHYEFTMRARTELENLTNTLAVLMPLREANRERKEHTVAAIGLHRQALADDHWPAMTTPQIFVASSHKADPDVMAVIMEVLRGFRGRVNPYYWNRDLQAGNVIANMLEQIQESQFGLCYFSEPAKEGSEHKYCDNPNVLFEAGLLQALTNSGDGGRTGWIPIREADSPDAPLDLALVQTITVSRDNGDVIVPGLQAKLKAFLGQMLA